jgi:hypothetical protein
VNRFIDKGVPLRANLMEKEILFQEKEKRNVTFSLKFSPMTTDLISFSKYFSSTAPKIGFKRI